MALPVIQDTAPAYDALSSLPCFHHIDSITAITSGYSQACVKVIDRGQAFFVKSFVKSFAGHSSGGDEVFDKEDLLPGADNEVSFSLAAAKAGISPAVVYQDPDYLICRYIDGEPLSSSTLNIREKAALALDLMASCHQLEVALPVLDMALVISELASALSGELTVAQEAQVNKLTGKITAGITPGPLVPCHGDINFSNILLATQPGDTDKAIETSTAWLIDFECCALAEKEFDLAMLIAVNEIPQPDMLALLEQVPLNTFLLNGQYSDKLCHYLAFCYLINALWYLVYQHESGDKQFMVQASRQFVLLDELALADGSFHQLFADFYPENEISC
ncbi:phosphotransferase [Thalassomonas actiniarum]|uniref:Phosphotransferase n=1 Tax=Thalassomonas actiniarum TaxID=485447 RepID=A0AAF0C1N2_9GAMM|nr:phosphotransferase [Thalassomonas actiniarum]WDD96894.1 phosphotransferase [Thalassomonas actiniarum]